MANNRNGAGRNRMQKKTVRILYMVEAVILVAALVLLIVNNVRPGKITTAESRREAVRAGTPGKAVPGVEERLQAEAAVKGSASAESEQEIVVEEEEEPAPTVRTAAVDLAPTSFHPHAVESTQPSNLISYTNIMVDGAYLDGPSEYQSDGNISFGPGSEYTKVDGIIGFRGNNYRNRPAYGFVDYKDLNGPGSRSCATGPARSRPI